MKYHLSKEVDFAPEWNGNAVLPDEEKVKFVLKVLSMGDVLLLMDTLETSGAADEEGNVNSEDLTVGTTTQLVNEATRLLPKYAIMEGLEDEEGAVIGVDTITQYPQFIGLITEVLFKLIEISTPNDGDLGNSNGLSEQADSPTDT